MTNDEKAFAEWTAAGNGVPLQYKGREHVWDRKVEASMKEGGAAFGVHPHMKAKRSSQDAEAAKNVPVDLARGFASGVLGAPGDIESLIRMPYDYLRAPTMSELVTGDKTSKTFLPTSEEIEKRLPFRSESPVSKAASGLGSLAGGFYAGPGSPLRVIGALPSALKHGAQEFAKASAAGVPHVIKPKGGNWLTGSVEKSLEGLKGRTEPRLTHINEQGQAVGPQYGRPMTQEELQALMADPFYANNQALNKWVDSNLTNYVKKQMATPDDPVRKLAEEGIVHIPSEQVGVNRYKAPDYRRNAGTEQLGQSEAAKAWEDASDVSMLPRSVQDLINPAFGKEGAINANIYQANKNKTEYPWLEKLAPESKVYGMGQNFSPSDLGFDHIMDVLREDVASGRIRPEQLNKVSMEQAVRRTYEYDQELAAKMNAARAAQREGLPVHKEYPEGYKWIELNKPGSFASESEAMGHSVRGYEPPQGHPDWVESSGNAGSSGYGHGGWEAIKSGKAKVYSLVDSKGAPHATVEVSKADPSQAYIEKQPLDVQEEFKRRFDNWAYNIDYRPSPEEIRSHTQYLFDDMGISTPSRISQIKGKQNAAPKEDYLPYVQDFVRGGKWSDVGDPQNAGLRRYGDVFNVNEQRAIEASGQPVPNHEYLSGEDIQRLHNVITPEGKRLKYDAKGNIVGSDEGLAHGGEIHMAGGGAAIKAALAKLGKFATEADVAAIKEAGRVAHEQEAWIRAAKNAEVEKKLQSMPPRSKSANMEMGMYHPVGGGLKLAKPFESLHSTRVPNPKVNKPDVKILTPEDLYRERAGLFPLVGDKADTGTFLTHIGEKELEVPVGLGGGPRYMDANYNIMSPSKSAAWESGTGRTTSLGNQAQRIAKSDRPAFGVYTAGSGTNTDFNIMGANAVLQQLGQSKLTKKAEKAFDKAMREEGTKAFPPIPDWPGIRSPQLEDMLLDKSNGILRTKLFDTMGKENFQSMGFPDVPATRKAIMDPQLYDVPTHESGFRIARMDPTGRIVEDPLHPSDYPTAMAGELEGQLDTGVDYKDMFSTHFANRRLLSQPESGDYYSFSRAFPIQYADQEWLDKIKKAQEAKDKLIKTGSYAKGGEVHMGGGGAAFGQYTSGKKYQKAKERAENADVNLLPDPRTYAAVSSFMGTAPDELGFSVMHPDYRAIQEIADPAFNLGLLSTVAPFTKGMPIGASIKPIKKAPQEEALKLAQQRAKNIGQSENPRTRMLQQGYEDDWYHGSTGDIKRFNPNLLGESTGAASAKKGFFFARDPSTPPAHLLEHDPWSVAVLKKVGAPIPPKPSMKGHGAETAGSYAGTGGSREYKEAMRKAKSAERAGNWDDQEKYMTQAEDAVTNEMRYRQSLVAQHGDARDDMLEKIQNAWYGAQNSDKFKNMSQSDYNAYDKLFKELMPYGWYTSPLYEKPQFKNLIDQISSVTGEKHAKEAADAINKYVSVRNERAAADIESGANVLPVALRYENPMYHDFEGKSYREQTYSDLVDEAKRKGHDALILKNTFDPGGSGGVDKMVDIGVVFDPDQIRSRFAAFDPLRKTAATAAAAGLAAPDLLAEEKKKARGGLSSIK